MEPSTITLEGMANPISMFEYSIDEDLFDFWFIVEQPVSQSIELFIGRYDTKKIFGSFFGSGEWGRQQDMPPPITEDDVGKDIPIYLATTPPPLGFSLNASNVASFKREAVC